MSSSVSGMLMKPSNPCRSSPWRNGTGPRRENVYSFMDIMQMGREKVAEEEIESRIKSVTPETVAAIIYTSGTTGRSKGVVLTQSNFVSNIHQASGSELMVRMKKKDVHLTALVHLPLCHVMGRSSDYHLIGLYLGWHPRLCRGLSCNSPEPAGSEAECHHLHPHVLREDL